MTKRTTTAARTALILTTLTTAATAGSESQNGILSGGGAPMTQQVMVDQFDTLGGTRVLDQVVLDFLTSTIGGGTSNGSGVPTQVFSQLDANWSFQSVLIAPTQALIDTTIANTGPPVSFTVFNTDTAQVIYDQPADLAPWIGGGQVVLDAFTQLQVSETPPGSTGFSAGGSVRWTVTYEFTVLDGAFCFGDGSEVACPCANSGAPGAGCDNAQGTGGVQLSVVSFAPDGLGGGTGELQGLGYPATSSPTVVLIRAPGRAEPPVPFGDGLRCIAAAGLVRLGAVTAAGGASSHPFGHGAGAGSFAYQLWYRNQPAAFCTPAAFNLSNGFQLTW
jgi:hypothetical protein